MLVVDDALFGFWEESKEPMIPVKVELIEAQSQGDIEVAASGTGSLASINLLISSRSLGRG